ncbi:MAG TPA: hypothetical protein VJI15_00790 [Candidatus Nanoarchaeia archaeon]|nr:hypothetical protein [Candidatus Nanoarchaeia archaeon]
MEAGRDLKKVKKDFKGAAREYFQLFSDKNSDKISDMLDSKALLIDWENNIQEKDNIIEAVKAIFESVERIFVEPLNIYQDGNVIIGDLLITINGKEKIRVIDILEFSLQGKIKSIKAFKQ